MNYVLTHGPWLGRGLVGAARAFHYGAKGYLTYKAFKSLDKSRGGGSTRGVTQQHDYATIYKKKSQPSGKRRKWIKFAKRVKAVTDKAIGTQNFLFNDSVTSAASAANQGVTSVLLYGGSLSNETTNTRGYSDINKVLDLLSPTADGDGTSPNVHLASRNGSAAFTSAVLDMTITNTGTTTIELDMYEIRFRGNKDIGQNGGRTMEDVYQAVLNSQAMTSAAGITGVNPQAITNRGWTPFNAGQTASQFGFKVMNKKKFFIGSNSCITQQLRDPKTRYVGYNQAKYQKDNWAKKYTVGYLFIHKTITGLEANSAIAIGSSRSYNVKVYQSSSNRDQTITVA